MSLDALSSPQCQDLFQELDLESFPALFLTNQHFKKEIHDYFTKTCSGEKTLQALLGRFCKIDKEYAVNFSKLRWYGEEAEKTLVAQISHEKLFTFTKMANSSYCFGDYNFQDTPMPLLSFDGNGGNNQVLLTGNNFLMFNRDNIQVVRRTSEGFFEPSLSYEKIENGTYQGEVYQEDDLLAYGHQEGENSRLFWGKISEGTTEHLDLPFQIHTAAHLDRETVFILTATGDLFRFHKSERSLAQIPLALENLNLEASFQIISKKEGELLLIEKGKSSSLYLISLNQNTLLKQYTLNRKVKAIESVSNDLFLIYAIAEEGKVKVSLWDQEENRLRDIGFEKFDVSPKKIQVYKTLGTVVYIFETCLKVKHMPKSKSE